MARLTGKPAGSVIIEYLGPWAGRNVFFDGTGQVAVTPTVSIQVFGTGVVKLQQNDQFIIRGERVANLSNQTVINGEKYADPTNWADLGATINAASGLVTRNPTIGNPDPIFLRLIVDTAGDGTVVIDNRWS